MKLSEKVNLFLAWMVKKLHLQEEVYYVGSSETLPPPLKPEEEQQLYREMLQAITSFCSSWTKIMKRQELL